MQPLNSDQCKVSVESVWVSRCPAELGAEGTLRSTEHPELSPLSHCVLEQPLHSAKNSHSKHQWVHGYSFLQCHSITKLFLNKSQPGLPQAFRFGRMLPQHPRKSLACSDSLQLAMGLKAGCFPRVECFTIPH